MKKILLLLISMFCVSYTSVEKSECVVSTTPTEINTTYNDLVDKLQMIKPSWVDTLLMITLIIMYK
jgi:hypothetical protein